YIPENLRDRPLRDPLVVEALESWASREAASIMVGLFVVAAAVTVAAVVPAMATPIQASSSRRETGHAGEPVSRRHPPAPHGGPGTVRVTALVKGKVEECEGTTALSRI